MSLQGQALAAYRKTLNEAMKGKPKEMQEEATVMGSGLLSRNKSVKPKEDQADPNDKSAYLMEQFKGLQRMRGKLSNG
jgi:hypothetical protein|tara:strand:+ start:2119 stop:2352 length:234 start_codon:yes stop_codon:yes gene_type:complete